MKITFEDKNTPASNVKEEDFRVGEGFISNNDVFYLKIGWGKWAWVELSKLDIFEFMDTTGLPSKFLKKVKIKSMVLEEI